jgi:hypothetical protein
MELAPILEMLMTVRESGLKSEQALTMEIALVEEHAA